MGFGFVKLLKTNVEKMSVYRLLAMLMKPNELKSFSGDVEENNGDSCWMMKGPSLRHFPQERRGGFQQVPVFVREGRGLVAVDIDFAQDAALMEDGHHDFRTCFQTAGEVSRVGVYVVHDQSLAGGSRRAADAPMERNPCVR